MAPSTDGERLFLYIRDRVLPELDADERVMEAYSAIGGTEKFGHFIGGAIAIQALRRLMAYWGSQQPNVGENMYVSSLARFVRVEMFPGLGTEESANLARLGVAAYRVSNIRIPPGVRKRVIAETINPRCYLCDMLLRSSVPESSADYLTLDHLWPSSLGGNSIEENLLPACPKCQWYKASSPSWEWFGAHDVVLSPSPSSGALRSVPPSAKIAIHFLKAMEACRDSGKTLKESIRRLGPVRADLECRPNGDMPLTFFDLRTYSET
jgi:hypothetical protein